MKSDSRTVFFLDAVASSIFKGIGKLSPPPIDDLISGVCSLSGKDEGMFCSKDGNERVYLVDAVFDRINDVCCMLINRSDKKAADTAYTDPPNRKRRVIQKEEGEGQDWSTHIVWSAKPHANDTYYIVAESSYGMSMKKIEWFLNYLCKKVYEGKPGFLYRDHPDGSKDKSGNPKRIRVRPRIELRGHISDEFVADLNAGRLNQIRLITQRASGAAWEERGQTREIRKVVEIAPKREEGVIGPTWDLVNAVCGKGRDQHYEQARIMFESETEVSNSVLIDTETMTIAQNHQYIKKSALRDFSVPLTSSFELINQEIYSKMKEIVLGL